MHRVASDSIRISSLKQQQKCPYKIIIALLFNVYLREVDWQNRL